MSMSTLSLNVQEWLIRLIQISLISIHFNASGSPASNRSGIQTYSYEEAAGYPSKINPYWHNHPDRISESNRLAADIHSSLLAETGAKDAGLLQSSFAVLRETDKPAVLLELGYIDNFNENQQIRSDAYQNRLVAGMSKVFKNITQANKAKTSRNLEAFFIMLLSY